MKEHKVEFEWIVDEWVSTEYQIMNGMYRCIDCIRGLSLNEIIMRM